MGNLKCFLFVSVLISASYSLNAKTIRYVKTDGIGDGSSWVNASASIQTMIDNSTSGDEVWVAKGTYYPTTETVARDARSRTFAVKSGVNLYGGFYGSENTFSQRVLADLDNNGRIDSCELVNPTILSGNTDGVADVWTKTMNADGKTWKWTVTGNEGNCYTVVTANSKVDGFSVIGGNANGSTNLNGGGINSNSTVINCTVSNCSANSSGGGIYASSYVINCTVSNCSTNSYGGGICSNSTVTNCTVSNCSVAVYDGGGIYADYVTNCTVGNCSANERGGGINASTSVVNCTVRNCSAGVIGGGICTSSYVTNCTVSNCSAVYNGGGIYSNKFVTNCAVGNCSADSNGGGIYSYYSYSFTNCASSNNKTATTTGSGIGGGTQTNCISPIITDAYIKPTSFIGVATTDAQKLELETANWRLKEGSPCINTGTSTNVSSTILQGKDFDGNFRVQYGTIDIGAYEYSISKISLPVVENFNNWTDFEKSEVLYRSAKLNTANDIKWTIANQKAVFSWQTNLITTYSQPIFTYQIDGTKSSKIYLRYDMYFQAYAGTISPLGTEQLNVEFSYDLVTWSTIATYSNANGTIANQTYKHDISTLAAGKAFFIRFNANGANSNRIEKWEIDNVIIDTDGSSAVNTPVVDKYKYNILDGIVQIKELAPNSLIKLYDTTGKIILSKNAETESSTFRLPHKGIYIISINSDKLTENKKIIW